MAGIAGTFNSFFGLNNMVDDEKRATAKIKVKAKGKTSVKDEDVASAVAHFSREKAKVLRVRLDEKKLRLVEEENKLKDAQRKSVILKRSSEVLSEKYKQMVAKKRGELVEEYRKVITKLKLHPMVAQFEVDSKKRVIVTTKMIKVKKENWEKIREAGIYQIRIDFSKNSYGDGIEILNITRRFSNYDSPTINNTRPCWGNIGGDIENDFNSQDLYELVIDLVDYIASPLDNDGYLSHPSASDANKKGWEQFLEKATKQEEGFCFEKYDQNQSSKIRTGISPTAEGTITIDNATSQMAQWTTSASTHTSMMPAPSGYNFQRYQGRERSVNPYMERFTDALRRVGFVQIAAEYYTRMIVVEGSAYPQEVSLELEERIASHPVGHVSQIILYVRRTDNTNERYFTNNRDFNPDVIDRLRQDRRLTYAIPQPMNVSALYENEAPNYESTVSVTASTSPSTSISPSRAIVEPEGTPYPNYTGIARTVTAGGGSLTEEHIRETVEALGQEGLPTRRELMERMVQIAGGNGGAVEGSISTAPRPEDLPEAHVTAPSESRTIDWGNGSDGSLEVG